MASARVISRFTIDDTNNVLIITHDDFVGDLTVTIDEGEYFWALDDEDDDFAKVLKEALDDATDTGTVRTWTVNIVGVDVANPTLSDGRLKLSASGGDFTLELDDAATTLDPRVLGWSDESSNPASASSLLYSDFNVRFSWYGQTQVYDAGAPRGSVTASQEITTGGYVDTVFWSLLDSVTWKFEFVAAALTSSVCGEDSGRAGRVNLEPSDPNAAFDIFYGDLIAGGRTWRFYVDQTDHGSEDYEGPFSLVLGRGTQHDTLGTADRPMPTGADLFHVSLPGLAVPED